MAEYLQIHRGNILGRIPTNVNNVQNGSVVEFNYRKKDGSQKKIYGNSFIELCTKR